VRVDVGVFKVEFALVSGCRGFLQDSQSTDPCVCACEAPDTYLDSHGAAFAWQHVAAFKGYSSRLFVYFRRETNPFQEQDIILRLIVLHLT
jgi:hypothetical protein